MNKSITMMARCLRLNVGLERQFWVEAVNMTCYLINGSQRVALNRKVVEEIWTCKEIDYLDIRVFRMSGLRTYC